MILMAACLLGIVSVAFGAYSEHALRDVVSEEHFRYLMTAVRYNQVYAVVTLGLALYTSTTGPLAQAPVLTWSAALFILGTVLFSFSIYVSVLFNVKTLLMITPFGGVTLMTGWTLLFIAGFLDRRSHVAA